MNPHGFGWLGRGLGFYSPVSVLLFLQYLVERNLLDAEYLASLAAISLTVGTEATEGRVTVANQNEISLRAALQATKGITRLRNSWQPG